MGHPADSISGKWGVFNHYLYFNVCVPEERRNLGTGITDWDTATKRFDVERLAYTLNSMNAGYYIITLQQGNKYMLAPNETYDRIAGTRPGEACSTRDLPMELSRELEKYGIDLCLYYTGDGPHMDEIAGRRMGFYSGDGNEKKVDENFVSNWGSVLKEYSERYGKRVKAWWIDGCYYDVFGYTDDLCRILYESAKAGNPDGAVAMNNGVLPYLGKGCPLDDFICGEQNDFLNFPSQKYIDGALAHTLAPLGYSKDMNIWGGWANAGTRHTREYMRDYIRAFTKLGGAVSVDIMVNIDGTFDPEQESVLKWAGNNL